MIEALTDLPEGVIGFRAAGTIESDDYRDQLGPAVEAAAAADGIRLVFVFAEFEGLGRGAGWQDLKLGFGHLTAWKRIALVTDLEWMTHMTHLFAWMTPGEVEVFPLAEQQAAIDWAAGLTDPAADAVGVGASSPSPGQAGRDGPGRGPT